MTYFDKRMECASRDEIYHIQSMELIHQIGHVYQNVAPYREKMDKAGIKPGDIRSIDDLCKLPFTEKQDLRDNYPYGMFAVPLEKVCRIHASSGTTGKQTVVGYTKKDIDIWAVSVARALTAAGCRKNDFVHVSYGYGLFTGGLGIHYGAEMIGAATIPASTGNTRRQIQILQDFRSSIITCTPSYALHIAETIKNEGIDPSTLHLKAGLFGAEPWTEEMRKQIEKYLNIRAYDIYGLSEISGPGVAYDCECQNGMHINEDHFIIEIVDPDTGRVLPDGETGEVVFTCITKEALPLIRYRTRDIASVTREKCGCGRTFCRMSKPKGRTDDMLIIRGVNVFPSQIESAILAAAQIEPNYMIYVDRVNNLDTLEVKLEMDPASFTDSVKGVEALGRKIRASVESTLGISAKITFAEPHSLPRFEGKSKRVVDSRK